MYRISNLSFDRLGKEITMPKIKARYHQNVYADMEEVVQPGDTIRKINGREGGLAIIRNGVIVEAMRWIMI
jgi:hypothetical protein